jgi:acyl-CoA thioesterase
MRVWQGRSPFSPAEKTRVLDWQRSKAHYFDLLGLRLADIEPGYCKLELPFKREISHGRGIVQGGILTTLADSCIAHATMAALLGENKHSTTLELKINFIRPALPSLFTAEAWLIHLGSRTAVGEAEIVNEEGKLIAKCLSSLVIIPDDPAPGGSGA